MPGSTVEGARVWRRGVYCFLRGEGVYVVCWCSKPWAGIRERQAVLGLRQGSGRGLARGQPGHRCGGPPSLPGARFLPWAAPQVGPTLWFPPSSGCRSPLPRESPIPLTGCDFVPGGFLALSARIVLVVTTGSGGLPASSAGMQLAVSILRCTEQRPPVKKVSSAVPGWEILLWGLEALNHRWKLFQSQPSYLQSP